MQNDATYNRFYTCCLTFYEKLSEKSAYCLGMTNRDAYEPKSIILMSRWPFIDNYKEILKQIYRISMSVNSVPLERIICNLIQELPLPDQGVTMIEYTIGNSTLWFSRPPPKYFPLWPDSSYEYLFRALKIEDVIVLMS